MLGGKALSDQAAAGGGMRHVAWLYRTPDEYLAGIRDFVAAGRSAGEPVLLALPAGRLSPGWNLSGEMSGARSLDTADHGRNPARLMPLVRAFADEHRGQDVRVVCELAWAGRSPPELSEVARYETMANLAFGATRMTMLCPYDVAGLPGSAITAACDSHPWLRQGGGERDNRDYRAPANGRVRALPLLLAPPGARVMSYQDDLRPVRALVAAEGARAGLSGSRRTDLVIAASEVAANTLKHTDGVGLVRIWVTADEILCQFEDSGRITDPLAGYGRPASDEPGGQGLWLVNQVCDLAEIRASDRGTTIRLHMFLGEPPLDRADRESARPRLGQVGRSS
jgi:anti-sigma regulatory factor (Ser/Thr protein kinase)